MNKNSWKIEYYSNSLNQWRSIIGFEYMNKSYAIGAWEMLKSFYNHSNKHRLLLNDEVIEEIGTQTIVLS